VNDAKRSYKSGRYAKAKTAFARNVRKVLQQTAEKKKSQYYEVDKFVLAANCTAASWLNTIFPVTPYGASLIIQQGTGDGSRVGNRIKATKLRLKGAFTPTAYSANNPFPEPMMVRMWLLYDKENPTIIPGPGSDFIQFGGATQGLQSTFADMISVVNSDRWVVKYDRTFKLGFAGYSGTGVQPAFQSFANNDFSLVQEFDIDVLPMIAKNIVFDDNTGIPETRGLFMVIEAVKTTGTAAAATLIGVEMHFSLNMEYTDM